MKNTNSWMRPTWEYLEEDQKEVFLCLEGVFEAARMERAEERIELMLLRGGY
jgi:hypothetical protein